MLALSILSISCQKQEQQTPSDSFVTLAIVSIGNTTEEHYTMKSKEATALQLLDMKHNTILNLGGNAVKCIDNVCAESGYWWPMFVNGKISTLGIHDYQIKSGDRIEFRFARR